jgi:hypothetical protein
VDNDVFSDKGLEPLESKHDFVFARRKSKQTIVARGVRYTRSLTDQLRAGGFDGNAGQRIPIVIGDNPVYLPRASLSGNNAADEHNTKDNKERFFQFNQSCPPSLPFSTYAFRSFRCWEPAGLL